MTDTSAFTIPDARGLPGIQAALRVTVALQCWGLGAMKLLDAGNSAFVQMRAMGKHVDPSSLAWLDQATGGFLLAAGLLALTRPIWPLLFVVCVAFAAEAFAPVGMSVGWHGWVLMATWGGAIVAPVALLLIDWFPPKARFSLARFLIAITMVRYGVAIAALALGLQAVYESRHAGTLAEHLQRVAESAAGRTLSDDALGWSLALIGAVCLAMGLNVLASRAWGVMAMLGVWGLLLAATHLVASGAYGVAEFLSRFAWAGLPVALALYWSRSVEDRGDVLRTRDG